MRDGIYKDLPLSRDWRSALRCCERPAEQGKTLCGMIERALESEARREFSSQFIEEFVRINDHDETSLPGMDMLLAIEGSHDLGGMNTPLENETFTQALQLKKKGFSGKALSSESLDQALQDRLEACWRQVQGHCLVKEGEKAKSLLGTFRRGLDKIDTTNIVVRLLECDRNRNTKLRRPIDVDGDDLTLTQ